MSDSPDLQAQVDALKTQVADLSAALDTATTEAANAKQALADLQLAARKPSSYSKAGRRKAGGLASMPAARNEPVAIGSMLGKISS